MLVEPNVRGSDGYGKAWLDADNGPKRLDVISDIDDAGRWIRANWARNGKAPRVGVDGRQLRRLLDAGRDDDVRRHVRRGRGDRRSSSNLDTFLRNTAPYRRMLRITEYGDPEQDAEALRQLSPSTLPRPGAGLRCC